MERLKLPIGTSDFKSVREDRNYYVDKTGFIRDVLESAPQVLMFPRPRRFGKSLNLSTLRYFLERTTEDRTALFEELAVLRDHGDVCRPHFQRYPVIFVSFKDVGTIKPFAALREEVRLLYTRHQSLLDAGSLAPHEVERFNRLLRGRGDRATLCSSLLDLSGMLYRHYGERVVILIDEYDSPMHLGYMDRRSYEQTVNLFRRFLSAALKDNPYLFKGVLTGIMRVAKESIFSGLNNLTVYSIIHPEFSTWFGFTEQEAARLAEDAGLSGRFEDMRTWYQGYYFGGNCMYNPWSLINYVNQKDERPGGHRHWTTTNTDAILRELVVLRGVELHNDFMMLMRGGAIEKPIEEHIALRDLAEHPEAVWSILVMAGYLRAEGPIGEDPDGAPICRLSFPNREVAGTYRRVFQQWLEAGLGGNQGLMNLEAALLTGNGERLRGLLENILETTTSSHDQDWRGLERREPEIFYHAFVLGLLAHLELGTDPQYEVRSNRESGHGRYDVMVLPKRAGAPGVVLEFKTIYTPVDKRPSKARVEDALLKAFKQIDDNEYTKELRARGASPIYKIAAAFHGKRVWVEVRPEELSGAGAPSSALLLGQ